MVFPSDESVLRDLRALLAEARQKVPPFLLQLDEISIELLELGGTCVRELGKKGVRLWVELG